MLFYATGVVRLCGSFSIDTFPHSAEKKLLGEGKSFSEESSFVVLP
jgi:hypothetical protein